MKKLFVIILAAATASVAWAEHDFATNVKVQVPFSFYHGEQNLQAGNYTLRLGPSRSTITIADAKGRNVGFRLFTYGHSTAVNAQGQLRFNCYEGNRCFLNALSIPGSANVIKILGCKLEKELMRGGSVAEARLVELVPDAAKGSASE